MAVKPHVRAKFQALGVYLPEIFDPGRFTPRLRDGAAYVVHSVYLSRHINYRVRHDLNGWTPLYTGVLDSVLGRKYRRPVLDSLIGGGVLECDRKKLYGSAGSKSYHYRLTPSYQDAKFRRHLITHGEVADRVLKYRAARHAEATKERIHARLRADLDRVSVADDDPSDRELALAAIADGHWHTKACPQGRYHTNLTNLDSTLRRFLRVDGRPVWCVDVANSQPLLLALTLQGREVEGYREYVQSVLGANGIGEDQPRPTDQTPPKPTPHTCARDSDSCLNDFLAVCLRGGCYEPVLELANRLKTRGRPYTRQELKALLLAVFYGSPADSHTLAGRAFGRLWPGVYNAIWHAKTGAAPGDKPGAELARAMQRRESHLIIWRAAARFYQEYPDVPLLTCHDSFMTTEEHIGKAEAVLKAEYQDAYGVEPTTTVKLW